ncbi:hypothetical protein AB0C32_41275, partial [Streptosporangium sp. NPDC048865]
MREIRRDDDGALMGFIRPAGEGWEPLTVFGYPMGAPSSEEEALEVVHRSGLEVLMRPWWFLEDGVLGLALQVELGAVDRGLLDALDLLAVLLEDAP